LYTHLRFMTVFTKANIAIHLQHRNLYKCNLNLMKAARSCNSEDQRLNTRNLCSRVCVVTWLRRISPWVTCFRFIHPYAMRSYVCARSTAQFSPLSCLFCHQGNNRILETIISTCKRLHTHTHTHTNLYHIFSSVTTPTPSTQHLCLPPIIVLVKSFILIYCKKKLVLVSHRLLIPLTNLYSH